MRIFNEMSFILSTASPPPLKKSLLGYADVSET